MRNPLSTQEIMLRNMESGPVTEEIAERAWGVGGENLSKTQEMLRLLGMKGYARERSPRALRLTEELGEAVLKPEKMKPKGFSDLDRLVIGEDKIPKVLGKPPGNAALDLDGITVIYQPESKALIRSRLENAGHSEEVIEAVIRRAEARREEYQKYLPEFKKYADDGSIPIEFNYRDNDSVPFAGSPESSRSFEFETISRENGPVIHVPKMADAEGQLKYITGDLDWVHFSWLDGTPLNAEAAGFLYDVLSRCCGMQHGETISWILEGQTIFKAKANQLVDYIKGGKALLEVSGDSLRAVHVVPEFTRFARNGREHLIFFDGGIKSLEKAIVNQADLENLFARATALLPPRPILLPYLWVQRADQADTTLNGSDWRFSSAQDALLVRQRVDGTIERFDGQEWVSWSPPENSAEPIDLTPTTALSAPVVAGGTMLPIVELDEDWAETLLGHLETWFETEVRVVVAPGELTQEVRMVTALGSLVLDRPLRFNHPEGTLVALVPANLEDLVAEAPDRDSDGFTDAMESRMGTDPDDPASVFRIDSAVVIQNGAVVTITFPSMPGELYALERTDELKPANWTVQTIVSGIEYGTTTSVSDVVLPGSPSRFYRVSFLY